MNWTFYFVQKNELNTYVYSNRFNVIDILIFEFDFWKRWWFNDYMFFFFDNVFENRIQITKYMNQSKQKCVLRCCAANTQNNITKHSFKYTTTLFSKHDVRNMRFNSSTKYSIEKSFVYGLAVTWPCEIPTLGYPLPDGQSYTKLLQATSFSICRGLGWRWRNCKGVKTDFR